MTASPEELLNALTTDLREAARNSRPLLERVEDQVNAGRATDEGGAR
jgi:hypothetical protein